MPHTITPVVWGRCRPTPDRVSEGASPDRNPPHPTQRTTTAQVTHSAPKLLPDWTAGTSAEEMACADERLLVSRALDPSQGTRTTPRDMVDLLRLIWTDQAGPAAACERVRAVMARQLTRHRIASGFRLPVRVAAKSGSLVGVIRNDIGVISFPDGRRYAAAVFTRSRPGSDDATISRAIGTVAARAVAALQETGA